MVPVQSNLWIADYREIYGYYHIKGARIDAVGYRVEEDLLVMDLLEDSYPIILGRPWLDLMNGEFSMYKKQLQFHLGHQVICLPVDRSRPVDAEPRRDIYYESYVSEGSSLRLNWCQATADSQVPEIRDQIKSSRVCRYSGPGCRPG